MQICHQAFFSRLVNLSGGSPPRLQTLSSTYVLRAFQRARQLHVFTIVFTIRGANSALASPLTNHARRAGWETQRSRRLGLGWRAASSSAAGAARADGALLCRNRIAGAGRHRICSQAGARGPTQGIKRAVSRPSTRVAPRCSSESYDWGATCLPPHTFLLAAAEAASALTPPAPHLAGTTSASQRAWLCHQTVTCTTLARRPAARARWCATRTC
eukprot:COSAG06_NODE_1236_length_10137_cov_3.357342_3_plen_215_part_00